MWEEVRWGPARLGVRETAMWRESPGQDPVWGPRGVQAGEPWPCWRGRSPGSAFPPVRWLASRCGSLRATALWSYSVCGLEEMVQREWLSVNHSSHHSSRASVFSLWRLSTIVALMDYSDSSWMTLSPENLPDLNIIKISLLIVSVSHVVCFDLED